MPTEVDFVELNKIDRYASRMFTLAVKFFGAGKAIASSTLRAELYPDGDERSFRRQFLRDRNVLASLGIVINELPTADDDTLWAIDEQSSYVQGDAISFQDARMLYVLCHDMVYDQSFPYRDELRVALVKIAQVGQGMTVPPTGEENGATRKALAALVAAMSNHEAVEARYVDAQGKASKRTLAPLGSFGLRGHTYFVAARANRSGNLEPDSVRTYRLDRFTHVSAVQPPLSYQVPQDFSVHDFERLPFQIGDTQGMAQLSVGPAPSREVARATSLSGVVSAEGIWEVPFSSLDALAAWCVGSHVQPIGPDSVVDAWHNVLAASATADLYDPQLQESAGKKAKVGRRSRKVPTDAVTKVRQLFALASSLTKEGKIVTAQQVAEALGIDHEQARHLIMLVTMGSGESYDYLPLVIDDDYDEVFLMEGAQLSVPQLRLTRSETLALSAALAQLGMPDTDPLAITLARSYAAPAFTSDDIERSLELPSSDGNASELLICSEAKAEGKGLRFFYQPVVGNTAAVRTVVPELVRRSDDNWYLDAYDLLRQDMRVFRLDRMSDLEMVDIPAQEKPVHVERHERMVTMRFDNPLYLDVFHWEGLEVVERHGNVTIARLPYYGGDWLARHLAACAGSAFVDDEAIAQRARELAQSPREFVPPLVDHHKR